MFLHRLAVKYPACRCGDKVRREKRECGSAPLAFPINRSPGTSMSCVSEMTEASEIFLGRVIRYRSTDSSIRSTAETIHSRGVQA